MNPPDAVPLPPPPPLALRIVRTIVRVGLAAVITLLVGLVLVSASSDLQRAFTQVLGWGEPEESAIRTLVVLAISAVMITGLLSVLGRRLSTGPLAIGWVVLAPILIYLTIDSPKLKRPQTLEEFSPVFPGAEASHELLMRYGNQHPAGRNFTGSKLMTWVGFDPEKPEPWIKFVTGNRAAIETEWQALLPLRTWWTELNAFDRIGDLTPAIVDAEIMAFRPVRELSQRACAIATLQALDGHGDAAIETLLPLLEVSRKLQPSVRTLLRQMIAIVIERMAMQTAGFVLDRTPVSPAVRARLATVLAAPGGGETGARRLFAMEYVVAVNMLGEKPLGDCIESVAKIPSARRALNAISPFVYNPRASLNLYADLTTDVEEILGRRQLDRLEPRLEKFNEHDARPRFKNFGGTLLIREMVPAFSKVSASYWKTQDDRAALLARVTAP